MEQIRCFKLLGLIRHLFFNVFEYYNQDVNKKKLIILTLLYPVAMVLVLLLSDQSTREMVHNTGPIVWPLYFVFNFSFFIIIRKKKRFALLLSIAIAILSILLGWRGMLFFFLFIQGVGYLYNNRSISSVLVVSFLLIASIVTFSLIGIYRFGQIGKSYYSLNSMPTFSFETAKIFIDLIAMRAREHLKGLEFCVNSFLTTPLYGQAFLRDMHEFSFFSGYKYDFNHFLKEHNNLWLSNAGGLPSTSLGQLIADFGKYGELIFYATVFLMYRIKMSLWQHMNVHNQYYLVGLVFYYEFLIIADQLYRNFLLMVPYVLVSSAILLSIIALKTPNYFFKYYGR